MTKEVYFTITLKEDNLENANEQLKQLIEKNSIAENKIDLGLDTEYAIGVLKNKTIAPNYIHMTFNCSEISLDWFEQVKEKYPDLHFVLTVIDIETNEVNKYS